jgi:hemolysin III
VEFGLPIGSRWNDGGPIYTETDLGRVIVEPWNAASALLFLGIALYWLIRLRGRYSQHPFLSVCLPILAAGGLGGTLYHATRASQAFFLMDVLPIFVLCLATSVYLWGRLLPKWWYGLALLLPYCIIQWLGSSILQRHHTINFSYACLAALILLPAVIFLVKTRFRHGAWAALAAVFFAVALYFRYADPQALLPMGTHWLWHTFGAAACWAVSEFLYCLEGDAPGPDKVTR